MLLSGVMTSIRTLKYEKSLVLSCFNRLTAPCAHMKAHIKVNINPNVEIIL